ncbi:hypothetical protein S101468_02729 [Acetobacter pasteurianus subsp. pasteurianus]|uniref:Uncharacterized protein n=1 Tax=Acetobacter pasteurianus subsp. pasteurianus TaxID=481145 RepID=A0AAC9SVI6_ACEPA|nr:hypothetical protein S101468_02729 [Acetobacter pasteurianus subsp. pasteurianus]
MTNQAHSTQNFSPRIDALAQRLRPIFARIADEAIDREENRILAHEAVKWLQGAGFGALRVPVRYGGMVPVCLKPLHCWLNWLKQIQTFPRYFVHILLLLRGVCTKGTPRKLPIGLNR